MAFNSFFNDLPFQGTFDENAMPMFPYGGGRGQYQQGGSQAPMGASMQGGGAGGGGDGQWGGPDAYGRIASMQNTNNDFHGIPGTPQQQDQPQQGDPSISWLDNLLAPQPISRIYPGQQPRKTNPTVSATESGIAIPDNGGMPNEGYTPISYPGPQPQYQPQRYGTVSASEDGSSFQPGGGTLAPAPLQAQAPSFGDYTPSQADFAAMARLPDLSAHPQFNFNGYSTPNDSTLFGTPHFDGSNFAQAGVNLGSHFIPGLDVLAGALQGFNVVGQAPGTGSSVADIAGRAGPIQSGSANFFNMINRNLFGGTYMPDSYIAPTLSGPSQQGGPDWNKSVQAARDNAPSTGLGGLLNGLMEWNNEDYIHGRGAFASGVGGTGGFGGWNGTGVGQVNAAGDAVANGGGGWGGFGSSFTRLPDWVPDS